MEGVMLQTKMKDGRVCEYDEETGQGYLQNTKKQQKQKKIPKFESVYSFTESGFTNDCSEKNAFCCLICC